MHGKKEIFKGEQNMYEMNKSVELFEMNGCEYLGNFENGTLITVDEKRKRILNGLECAEKVGKDDFAEDPEFLEELEKGGYFESIEQPLCTAYLHVTNICNLNCIGCYSFDRTRNCSDKLSFDNIKYIIDQLAENDVRTITISGGEPLIRSDIVDIVKYMKDNARIETVNLITNGTLYNEEVLLELREYVDALPVSIDGYSFEHPHFLRDKGTFPKVMKFVEQARDMNLPVSILPTLHRKNIDFISEYMKLSEQLKVPISFSLLTCSGELKDFIPTEENLHNLVSFLFDFMKSGKVPMQDYSELEARKNCGAGSSIISVTAEGDIYPCHMMHDTDTCMGNILKTPLKEILKNSKQVPTVDQIETCSNCEVRNVCGGGCKARALLLNGGWNHPDPYCGLNEQFYRQFVEEMSKRG